MKNKKIDRRNNAEGHTHETSEFDRRYPVSLFQTGREFDLKARPDELKGIATRLAIPAVNALQGHIEVLNVRKSHIHVKGHLNADLIRQCVITAEDIPETLDLDFNLVFIEADDPLLREGEEEEYFPYKNHEIDLGGALIEQTALEMDPYPRANNAGLERFVEEVPVAPEEDISPDNGKPNPFAVLKNLKLKDGK